jgi:hypothetical protein
MYVHVVYVCMHAYTYIVYWNYISMYAYIHVVVPAHTDVIRGGGGEEEERRRRRRRGGGGGEEKEEEEEEEKLFCDQNEGSFTERQTYIDI